MRNGARSTNGSLAGSRTLPWPSSSLTGGGEAAVAANHGRGKSGSRQGSRDTGPSRCSCSRVRRAGSDGRLCELAVGRMQACELSRRREQSGRV